MLAPLLALVCSLLAALPANAVPVSLEYSWAGAFQVFGYPAVPQINGFDYAITDERVEYGLAGQSFTLTGLSLMADGFSSGERVNFDVEIHLSGRTIGLPSGQYVSTHVDPVAGYTRTADSQFMPVVGDVPLTGAFNLAVNYDAGSHSATASPSLALVKQFPSENFFLNDGLHAQLFFWTADNRNVDLSLQNVRLRIDGDAPNGMASVPEPSSQVLLTIGSLALVLARRRRSALPDPSHC